MLTNKGPSTERRGQKRAIVECQAKRGRVIAEGVVGRDCLGDHVRPLWGTSIDMLPIVAKGPTIKRAVLHGRKIVGNEITTEFIALVDNSPQRLRLWFPCHSVGIAQA